MFINKNTNENFDLLILSKNLYVQNTKDIKLVLLLKVKDLPVQSLNCILTSHCDKEMFKQSSQKIALLYNCSFVITVILSKTNLI